MTPESRSARRAAGTTEEAQAQGGRDPQHGEAGEARAVQRNQAEALARDADEIERGQCHRDRASALAHREGQRWRSTRAHRRRPPRAAGVRTSATSEAEGEMSAQEDLEEGDRRRPGRRPGSTSRGPRPPSRATAPPARPEPGPGRGRPGSRAPARGARSRGAGPSTSGPARSGRTRRRNRSPRASSPRAPRPAGDRDEPRRRGAHGEEQRDREHGDVEARDGVVGVDRRPAQRRRAHEVRAQVIAEGKSGDARHLRRVAEGQLADEAHVEGGVVGDERVEQELARSRPRGSTGTGSRPGARRGPARARLPHAATVPAATAADAPPGQRGAGGEDRDGEEPGKAGERAKASTRPRRRRSRAAGRARDRRRLRPISGVRDPGPRARSARRPHTALWLLTC